MSAPLYSYVTMYINNYVLFHAVSCSFVLIITDESTPILRHNTIFPGGCWFVGVFLIRSLPYQRNRLIPTTEGGFPSSNIVEVYSNATPMSFLRVTLTSNRDHLSTGWKDVSVPLIKHEFTDTVVFFTVKYHN